MEEGRKMKKKQQQQQAWFVSVMVGCVCIFLSSSSLGRQLLSSGGVRKFLDIKEPLVGD